MSNLTKFEFIALDISDNNYLAWTLDAEIHLDVINLGDTIKEENKASLQDHAKVMIFLRHHLQEELKTEYLIVKDSYVIWKILKERYDHQKTVILPKARYDWMHLNTSQLKLYGESVNNEDMLEKIFSILYRGFKKYSELISCLVAKQNNELLMKNHQSRPTGSIPSPEANVAINDSGRSRYRGHGRGYYNQKFSNFKRNVIHHRKWENNGENKKKIIDKTKFLRLMKAIIIDVA
ncbi:hypothetical protein Pfo_024473 [Paulownia fortunei]|nr:hypothetical protein Pfo_024473 [Paulownia fortunei]